jgi:hypothetical protein
MIRVIASIILIAAAAVALYFMPVATNSDSTIRLDRIHIDNHSEYARNNGYPTNLVMKVDEADAAQAVKEANENRARQYASPAARRPPFPVPTPPDAVDATEKEAVEHAVAVFGRTLKPCVPPNCIELAKK